MAIRCAVCRFPQEVVQKRKSKWKEIVCGNEKSEYHKAALNVCSNGTMQDSIIWSGCEHGERRVKS